MYGYALRTLRDPASAEDVIQESLLTIWQRAKSFRGEGRVIAWLFGIVHHKTMRAYREKVNVPLDEAIRKLLASEPQVDARIISQDRKDLLREGMEMLSIDHRTVLELVFYQEMTMKEISKICGVPVGTVKSRLNYAKAALKGVLTRQGRILEDMT